MSDDHTELERNRRVVLDYLEDVYGGGRLDRIDELYAEDYVANDAPPGLQPGPHGIARALADFRSAFPDVTVAITFVVAEGDLVTARFVTRGTHRADLFGIPATHRTIEISATFSARLRDGRIAESWVNGDDLGMWTQLGVLSKPG